jgi:hypothetical protein
MGVRLLVAVLVVTLSGANSALASMCAAYCMSSATAGTAAAHSHQTESQQNPARVGHHVHQGPKCAECPPKSGNRLNHKADCASLVQIQTLKQGSFNLEVPRGVAQFDAADAPIQAVGLRENGERSLAFDTSRSIRSFPSPSLLLRI